MQSSNLRQLHASRIFYSLLVAPDVSQRELCLRTGFDKSTVSLVIRNFEELGIVERRPGQKNGRRGRPEEQLRISSETGLLVGVHLEYDSLRFVGSTLGGKILSIHDAELPQNPHDLGSTIAEGLTEFCSLIERPLDEIQSVGITLPGQTSERGELEFSPNLNWRNVDVGAQLLGKTNCPVFIDNDVNAEALAEHFFGAAIEVQDFVLISGGLGVGAALFLNNDVYRGMNGFAGEFGHTKVVMGGRRCHCGARGCIAAYLSLPELYDRASKLGGRVSTIDTLEARAKAGEESILELLSDSGGMLGVGVANMVNLLNPPLVIVGGLFARLWPYFEVGFRGAFCDSCLNHHLSETTISVSEIGMDRVPRGGVALALLGLTNLGGLKNTTDQSTEPLWQNGSDLSGRTVRPADV